MTKMLHIKNLKEMEAFAASMAKNIAPGTVIALSGDLGAGKTTFAQAFGRALGITKRITSPTFTLMNLYPVARKNITQLVHMDCYRFASSGDALAIGLEDFLSDGTSVLLIEWAEKIKDLLPKETVWIDIKRGDHEERVVEVRTRKKNR